MCVHASMPLLRAATFVGGGFILGLTEAVYSPNMGLLWAVMPVTAALSFIVGKRVFQLFSHYDRQYCITQCSISSLLDIIKQFFINDLLSSAY